MLWLEEKFAQYPDRTGIIYNDKPGIYKDLFDRIQGYKVYLQEKSVKAGDVAGIVSHFSLDSIALFLALADMACIVVPLDKDNVRTLEETIKNSYIDHLFRLDGEILYTNYSRPDHEKHPLIRKLQDENRAGMILFSSGTTGLPKIMLHDLTRLIDSYKTPKVKDTNSLILLGFDHIGGIDSMLRLLAICAGITLVSSRKPVDICEQIEKHKVNVLPTTPTFLNLLILSEAYKEYNLSSLEIIGFGAEAISQSLLQKLKLAFPNVKLQQKFGTSETNAIRIKNDNVDEQYFSINDPGVEYKIVEGELWLKSKSNILGYLNSDIPAFDDGWFKTGDLVEVRENQIRIIGRKKEVINVGGEKVLPADVEEVLLGMTEILDCKVYGIENLLTGQVVAADVVVNKNADKAEIKSMIRQHCKKNLNNYQVPVKINLVDEIELSARNKKIRS